MVARGWVDRAGSNDSRREVLVTITDSGRELVDRVTQRRREDISEILGRLTPSEQESIRAALTLFAEAAGERRADDALVLGT